MTDLKEYYNTIYSPYSKMGPYMVLFILVFLDNKSIATVLMVEQPLLDIYAGK